MRRGLRDITVGREGEDVLRTRQGGGSVSLVGLPLLVMCGCILYSACCSIYANGLRWPHILALPIVVLAACSGYLLLWRAGVVLDRRHGSITDWWGLPFAVRKRRFLTGDYRHVTVKSETRRRARKGPGSSSFLVFPVRLEGGPRPITFGLKHSREEALQVAGEIGKFLGLPVADQTMLHQPTRPALWITSPVRLSQHGAEILETRAGGGWLAVGWVGLVVLIGALAYGAVAFFTGNAAAPAWFTLPLLLTVLLVAAVLLGARRGLILNKWRDTATTWRGLWGPIYRRERPLSACRKVVLDMDVDAKYTGARLYRVHLVFETSSIKIGTFNDYGEARKTAERLAEFLGLPLVDTWAGSSGTGQPMFPERMPGRPEG